MATITILNPEQKGKRRNTFEVKVVPGGFEFFYGGKWYGATDGVVAPLLFTPAQQGDKKSKNV
jgi:hypothetical protein